MSRGEHGYVTLWVLGVAMMVIFVGGISLDLWRVAATRRAVASAVDGAAIAGASGLDEAAFRASAGEEVRLDPGLAEELAVANLQAQPDSAELVEVAIEPAPERITVRAARPVELTLLRIFLAGEPPVVVRASSTVDARRSP